MEDLSALIDRLGCPRVLVVGDLILDRYTHGDAERFSPEAPVPVLRADEHEARPGGAASVAALLRALGAEVRLAGVVGDDADGRVLSRLLAETGVDSTGIQCDPERPTTSKERFLGRAGGRHAQQILRVDRESRAPLPAGLECELATIVAEASEDCGAILVSDYGKGVCTPGLLASLADAAASHDVPVLVDPTRIPDYARYRGAEVIKPNRIEAELAIGRAVRSVEDALAAGRELCTRWGFIASVLTLDRDGMALARSDGTGEWFPARTREVYDITGAGDMVLAVLGLGRAANLSLEVAARLANVAAGLEVERPGVATISRSELRAAIDGSRRGASKVVTAEELTRLAAEHRRAGRKIVFTNGCFDLLHAGHLACLQQAARLGDVLVVAVNDDASVRTLKGPDRPAVPEAERAALVSALGCVDHVVLFGEATPLHLLNLVRPDVLVKGGTYSVEGVVGRELVEGYGGRVCVTGEVEGRSTTRLLARLAGLS